MSIRPATVADLDAAAETLADAFVDYPWTRWSIPADDYRRRLADLQRIYLGYALADGVVLVDDGLTGVIAMLPPTAPPPADHLQARIAELHGGRLAAVAAVDTAPLPDGTWHLATIGVRPDRQGTGVGGALLRAGVTIVDDADAAIGLETSDETNVALYKRFGFHTVGTISVDVDLPVHSMLRPARGQRTTS